MMSEVELLNLSRNHNNHINNRNHNSNNLLDTDYCMRRINNIIII
jgi:hypothetical protein